MEEPVVPEQESGESGISNQGIRKLGMRNQGSENQEPADRLSPESQPSNHPTIQPRSANLPAPRLASVTVLVGLAMLLVGVLVGYFGRPLVTPRPPEAVAVAATASQEESADASANPGAATFMDAIVAQTRHFRGNADAPVTMVEFGDFQ